MQKVIKIIGIFIVLVLISIFLKAEPKQEQTALIQNEQITSTPITTPILTPETIEKDNEIIKSTPTPIITPAIKVTPTPTVKITPIPVQPDQAPQEGDHTFYLSTYKTAKYYYCDTDDGWKSLTPKYLKSYPAEKELLKDYPTKILHEACK